MERDFEGKMIRNFKPEDLLVGSILLDNDFRVVDISEESANLLNSLPSDLLSKKFGEDFGPSKSHLEENLNGITRMCEFSGENGFSCNCCFRIKKNDSGYDVIFFKEGSNFKCGDGKETQFSELKREKEHFERYCHFLENVLASIGHDIKTPLGVILGYCELILRANSHPSPVDTDRAIRTIHRNCSWLANVVENLEDFSSIIKRGKSEEKVLIDISSKLQETIKRLSKPSFAKQIRIELQNIQSVKIYASPIVLSALLDELIRNSIASCRKNGDIFINLMDDEQNKILEIEIPHLEEEFHPLTQLTERLFPILFDSKKEDFSEKVELLGFGAVKHLALSEKFNFKVQKSGVEGYILTLEFS